MEPLTLAEADRYSTVIVGEPYNDAIIGRKGARNGPDSLRKELASTKTHHFNSGPIDGVGDLGNIEVPKGSTADIQTTILEIARKVHSTESIPIFLGGDNSLT